jgi:hypothetical protein
VRGLGGAIDQGLAAPYGRAGRFDLDFAVASDAEGHQQTIR